MKALAKRTFSRSPAAAPITEQPRLLRIEPREEDFRQSRLPTPSSSLLESSTKKGSVSKLPKPAAQMKLEPARNGSRGLLRAPQDCLILEEDMASLLPAPRRAEPPPTPVRSSTVQADIVNVEPLRESGLKYNSGLPAPSSGIPKPLSATAKTPIKSGKLEKRLSFPPNPTVSTSSSGPTDALRNDGGEGNSTERESVIDGNDVNQSVVKQVAPLVLTDDDSGCRSLNPVTAMPCVGEEIVDGTKVCR